MNKEQRLKFLERVRELKLSGLTTTRAISKTEAEFYKEQMKEEICTVCNCKIPVGYKHITKNDSYGIRCFLFRKIEVTQ